MESSTRLIATNAEKDYLSQQAINQNYNATSIPCADVAKLNDNYSSCTITYNSNGVATVKLKGASGSKFAGIKCSGTKDSISCTQSDPNAPEYVYSFDNPLTYNITNPTACKNWYLYDYMEYNINDTIDPDDDSIATDICDNNNINWFYNALFDNIITKEELSTFATLTINVTSDYTTLGKSVFLRWPGDTENFNLDDDPEVCILYRGNSGSDVNCFSKGYSTENTDHINQVFGESNCGVYSHGEKYSCANSNKGCTVPTDFGFTTSCGVNSNGGDYECTINYTDAYCTLVLR